MKPRVYLDHRNGLSFKITPRRKETGELHSILKDDTWYMVQIEALSTPECQEGVPSPGGQHEEGHRVVHHVAGCATI